MAIETGHMLTTNNRITKNHRNKQGVMQTTRYSNKYWIGSHYKRGSRIMEFPGEEARQNKSWVSSLVPDWLLLVVAVDEVWLGSWGSQASVAERVLQKWRKGLHGDEGWQIVHNEPHEISSRAIDEIDACRTWGIGGGKLNCDIARVKPSLLKTSMP